MKFKFKQLFLLIFFCYMLFIPVGCGSGNNKQLTNFEDLSGRKVGVMVGTIHDQLMSKNIPEAEIVYFNDVAGAIAALNSGSIDGVVYPASGAQFLLYENPGLTIMERTLRDAEISFIFPKSDKGRKLNEEFSEFINQEKEKGEIDRLRKKWFAESEAEKTLPAIPQDGANGVITLATSGTTMPYTYIRDNEVVGLEIEMAALFAEEYGYGLKLDTISFDGILPAVKSEKDDFGDSCFAITDERKESVDFAAPYTVESVVIIVRNVNSKGVGSILDTIIENFKKTFIREERYKLFGEGILVTLEISVFSIAFGTLIGFIVYMLCRKGGKIPNKVTKFCVWLIQGMPILVFLMILYYILLAKTGLSPLVVSIIGFTFIFAAAVYGMINMGVNSIDVGQTEAAYALGYTDTKTFFKIILPQAARHFMPSFKAQVTSLLKATSVVGFISVTDLTRAGDLIRSRTYEPFFSLIAVAVMYFVLAGILNAFSDMIDRHLDPENSIKKKYLKGVKTDD